MSVQSSILATGFYRTDLREALDYTEDQVLGLPEGTPIASKVIHCTTSSASYSLAEALGFNLYDIEKHYISSGSILKQKGALELFAIERREYNEEIEKLLLLAQSGNFYFWFIPDN